MRTVEVHLIDDALDPLPRGEHVLEAGARPSSPIRLPLPRPGLHAALVDDDRFRSIEPLGRCRPRRRPRQIRQPARSRLSRRIDAPAAAARRTKPCSRAERKWAARSSSEGATIHGNRDPGCYRARSGAIFARRPRPATRLASRPRTGIPRSVTSTSSSTRGSNAPASSQPASSASRATAHERLDGDLQRFDSTAAPAPVRRSRPQPLLLASAHGARGSIAGPLLRRSEPSAPRLERGVRPDGCCSWTAFTTAR